MTLDELLLEWSYRSEKGYPSLDSPSDVLLLEKILKELDLPTDEILSRLEQDEPGGDDIETPGTDGMEDSEIESDKEETVIRHGTVKAEQPKIVTPQYMLNLEGFSENAHDFMEELAENIGPNAPGILYQYKNESTFPNPKINIKINRNEPNE